MAGVADETNGWAGISLDPSGGIIGAGPTFTIYEDTSQPVELPPSFEWVGPAPTFGVDYGPGITAPVAATVAPGPIQPPVVAPPVVEPPPQPPVGNPYIPPLEPPGEPLRVPFPVPPGGWLGPVIVGAGAAIWEGWPNALGSGEVWDSQRGVLTPIDVGEIRRKRRGKPMPDVPVFRPALPPGVDPYGLYPLDEDAIKRQRIDERERRRMTPPIFEPDRGLYPIKVEGKKIGPRDVGKGYGVTLPPVPVFTPIPAPTRGQRARARARKLIGKGQAVLGGLGLLGELLGNFRTRGRDTNLAIDFNGNPTDPLTNIEAGGVQSQLPTTALIGFPITQTGGEFDQGDKRCKCRDSGPRRKCLERAPIVWSGGRRKGKRAGTKCVRWAGKPERKSR